MRLPQTSCAALGLSIHILSLSSRCLGAPVLEDAETPQQQQQRLQLLVQKPGGSEPVDFHFASLFENAVPSSSHQDQDQDQRETSIPSRYHSTVLARRLLHLSTHADLVTTFPASQNLTARTPPSVGNTPIGLPEYIATCEGQGQGGEGAPSNDDTSGGISHAADPTILSLKVSTATRNVVAGSNASLTISWWDEYARRQLVAHDDGSNPMATIPKPYSPANLPRLALTGYLEEITFPSSSSRPSPDCPSISSTQQSLEACFLKSHPDSVMWLPGRKWAAHQGFWSRLVVQEAYWIGGFGDRNYIGWLDVDEWRGVTAEEWRGVKLPGE